MAEKRFLITIGINDYELNPLNYCVKDSQDILQCMQTHCNVEISNSFSVDSSFNQPVTNPYDTLQTIILRIESQLVQEEDSLFFYFSGHGVPATNSTSILLKERTTTLQELFDRFKLLKPKFLFLLIDSCYSGVGITEPADKSSNQLNFNQQVHISSGYNIICASAADAPAKESSAIQNGRLTRLFIDIVQNKRNYSSGVLSLSKVYHLIDEVFKENPELRQFPFAQTKGLSTYPLSFHKDDAHSQYFSIHYIDDVDGYNWIHFQKELLEYCSMTMEIAYEFTRLVREILRNCKQWSKATFTKVEIGHNCVSIVDNSGTYFDIFNPPDEAQERGGLITAKVFRQHYEKVFEFSCLRREGETIQIFNFLQALVPEDTCKLVLNNAYELWSLKKRRMIEIPENCTEYSIDVPAGMLDISVAYTFIASIIESSQQFDKPIIITIDKNDKLKDELSAAFARFKDLGPHKVFVR